MSVFISISSILALVGSLAVNFQINDHYFPAQLLEADNVAITEINYDSDDSDFILNYVELYNATEQNIDLSTLTLRLLIDESTYNDLDLSSTIFPDGYILINFVQYYSILPDLTFDSIVFSNSLLIELVTYSNDETFQIIDSLLLTKNNTSGFQIETGTDVSVTRKEEFGEYLNTGDNNEDFTISYPSPINSALGVALYIMAENIVGQAQYKYPVAKGMLMSLTNSQLNYFRTDGQQLLKDARQRYRNWAAGVGDPDPYNEGITSKPFKFSENILLIGLIFLGLVSIGGYFVVKRKKV